MTLQIRWTHEDEDRDARVEIIRRAWHGAYAHIFTAAEIDGVFDGGLTMTGDWLARRSAAAGTLVATLDDEIVGLAGLGLLEPGVGEVAALYVAPEHQGAGIGRELWRAGLAVFGHRTIDVVELFALADAAACSFYERMGCRAVGDATVAVGGHRVRAINYRLDPRGPGETEPTA